jgi:hypothetical protein
LSDIGDRIKNLLTHTYINKGMTFLPLWIMKGPFQTGVRFFSLQTSTSTNSSMTFFSPITRTFQKLWKEYFSSSHLLSIKMPKRLHKRAGWSLANLIINTAEQQMGDLFRLLNQGASDR